MDIKDLHRQGYSVRQIARLTGLSRNTISRKLAQSSPSPFASPSRPSQLDSYKPYLEARFRECGLSAVRLLAEVRPMGYTGSIDVLRRYIATLRPQTLALQKATVRFETPPGQQAQADWGYCGRFPDQTGRAVPIYVFTMVLGFSRMLFVRFTTSMDVPTLIACHQEAFAYWSGWPREILYDNMAQVRLSHSREFNPQMLDFANHHGFTMKTHRVRRPRTKGKVERMVFYVKDNFLNGRSFAGLGDLNAGAMSWLNNTANVRVHATTECRPVDLLAQEGLTPVDAIVPYKLYPTRVTQVNAESFVRIGGSRYSVPPSRVGQTVTVTLRERKVVVYAGDLIVAEHDEADQPGSCVAAKEHMAELWKLSLASADGPLPHWQMTFRQEVAQTPLSAYDAAAGCSANGREVAA